MTDQTALLDAPVIQFTTVSESRALVVIDQGPNLAALAKSINHHINRALAADISGERHRVKAGRELIEAREHVPPGDWIAWCKANIKRGQRDIQRLMRIAGAEDPDAALELDRAKAREGMKATRAKATNVSRVAGASRGSLASTPTELFAAIAPTLNYWSDADASRFSGIVANHVRDRHAIYDAATPANLVSRIMPEIDAMPDKDMFSVLWFLAREMRTKTGERWRIVLDKDDENLAA